MGKIAELEPGKRFLSFFYLFLNENIINNLIYSK